MRFKIIWTKLASSQIEKIDKSIAEKIRFKIENYLAVDPDKYGGKALVGNLKGFYSLRYSNYRVIYKIHQREILIEIIEVGHRKSIYE